MGFDLGLSDDQIAIRELLDGFSTREAGAAVVRAAEPLGFDQRLWEKCRGVPNSNGSVAVHSNFEWAYDVCTPRQNRLMVWSENHLVYAFGAIDDGVGVDDGDGE
jgi:hypothetical protein